MLYENKKNYTAFNNKSYRGFDNFVILKYLKKGQKVLDVGCSEGELGAIIKEKFNSKVYGIEISEKAIEIAKKRLDKVMKINIEDEFELDEKNFDVIIFADILEHLYNPEQCINKFKKYLADDGYFIISIPNIANWLIRLKLLFGNFDYEPAGILDDTHIRFFTFKSIKKMIEKLGLKIKKIDCTYNINIPLLSRYKFFRNFIYFITKGYKNLLARQFIIVAEEAL